MRKTYSVCKLTEQRRENDGQERYTAYNRMRNAREEAYRIDLAKEMTPELSNNIFNFKLENENRTLYMSIDIFNTKIFVYDAVVE